MWCTLILVIIHFTHTERQKVHIVYCEYHHYRNQKNTDKKNYFRKCLSVVKSLRNEVCPASPSTHVTVF